MHSKARAATKPEKKRFEKIVEIGCVACRQDGHNGVPGEVHHILDGMKRAGHGFSVCLCPFHHRGIPPGTGPSLADGSRLFYARYGSPGEILAYQNSLIAQGGGLP